VQALFHVQELLHLAFQQAVDRDAGPLGNHRGDFFCVHLFLEQRAFLLLALQLQFSFANLVFKLADGAIAQARSFSRSAFRSACSISC